MNLSGGVILAVVSLGLLGCSELPVSDSSETDAPQGSLSSRLGGSPRAFAGDTGGVPAVPEAPTDASPATADVSTTNGASDETGSSPSADVSAAQLLPYPSCPIHASTRFAIRANLDSSNTVPMTPWDPQDPANTANFSDTLTLVDVAGRPLTMDLYFRKEKDSEYSYHALVSNGGQNLEVGTGILNFSAEGLLERWTETLTLEIPGASGEAAIEVRPFWGHSIASFGSGADGITQFSSASNVRSHRQDGHPGIIGRPCETDEPLDAITPWPVPDVQDRKQSSPSTRFVSDCTDIASGEIAFVGSLNSAAPLPAEPWDPRRPYDTSTAATFGRVKNAKGEVALLEIYFRRESAERWTYHVMLNSTVLGVELGSGEVSFSSWGTLGSSRESKPLRFPNPDGTAGDPILVKFSGPLDARLGWFIDLSTYATETYLYYGVALPRPDATRPECAGVNLASVAPPWVPLPWSDSHLLPHRTTALTISAWLSNHTPISNAALDTEAARHGATSGASQIVYDALGHAFAFTPYFMRRDLLTWEVFLFQAEASRTRTERPILKFSGTLTFNESGKLVRIDSPSYLSLSQNTERDDSWVDVYFVNASVTLEDCAGDQCSRARLSGDGFSGVDGDWFDPI